MRTLVLLFLCLLPACETPTMGDRFHDFGVAYCQRQVECDLIDRDERDECIDAQVTDSCFEPRDCDSRDYYLHEDMWDECLDQLGGYACEMVAKSLAPASCINAWRPPGHRL